MIRAGCIVLAFSCLPAVLPAAEPRAAAPLYVGVLEIVDLDKRPCVGGELQAVPLYAQVRYAFRKDADGWHSMAATNRRPPLPETMTWHLAHEGRKLGEVRSAVGPCDNAVSGLQIYAQDVVTNPEQVPKPAVGEVMLSPLASQGIVQLVLAVSAPNLAEPQRWSDFTGGYDDLSEAESQQLIGEFRKLLPKRPQCTKAETGPYREVEYRDEEILVTHVYRSPDGTAVVGQKLSETRRDCQGFDDPVARDYWFALHPDGTIRRVGERMTLLAVADVDADGRSELIFKWRPSPYPSDGYLMLYDGARQQVEIGWGYN